jgi:hypothetical protein
MIAENRISFFSAKQLGFSIEEATTERNEKQETAHC